MKQIQLPANPFTSTKIIGAEPTFFQAIGYHRAYPSPHFMGDFGRSFSAFFACCANQYGAFFSILWPS